MIYVQKAKECGEALGDDFLVFRAELLKAQNQMSGWCNIFFCAQDIEISDKLIEKLNAYHYKIIWRIFIFMHTTINRRSWQKRTGRKHF